MAVEVQSGKAHAVANDSDRLVQTQSGLFERNILCAQCDNKIGVFENTAITAFRKIRDQAKHMPNGQYVLNGFTGDDIVRFVAGLLWKYSVASNGNGRIDLGPYQDELKGIAFCHYPIQSFIDVILVRLKRNREDDGVFAYRAPSPDRQEGVNGYRILVGGMFIFVKLDKRCPRGGALSRFSIRGMARVSYAIQSALDFEEYSIPNAWIKSGKLSGFLDKQDGRQRIVG